MGPLRRGHELERHRLAPAIVDGTGETLRSSVE
jgi:hypothetical protein